MLVHKRIAKINILFSDQNSVPERLSENAEI